MFCFCDQIPIARYSFVYVMASFGGDREVITGLDRVKFCAPSLANLLDDMLLNLNTISREKRQVVN